MVFLVLTCPFPSWFQLYIYYFIFIFFLFFLFFPRTTFFQRPFFVRARTAWLYFLSQTNLTLSYNSVVRLNSFYFIIFFSIPLTCSIVFDHAFNFKQDIEIRHQLFYLKLSNTDRHIMLLLIIVVASKHLTSLRLSSNSTPRWVY